MTAERKDSRLALPSKGRLAEGSLTFLAEAGLRVHKPNPRQFEATIPAMPGLAVLFQRAGDIVVSVRDGSVDFGITGWDMVSEYGDANGVIMPLHKELGFGHCTLNVIVPESWEDSHAMADLAKLRAKVARPLRAGTKFPNLTGTFFRRHGLEDTRLIKAEGTLEAAPAIGYADLIIDLVSTGTTLRDNRLKAIEDGLILTSQACLIANRDSLKSRSDVFNDGAPVVGVHCGSLTSHLQCRYIRQYARRFTARDRQKDVRPIGDRRPGGTDHLTRRHPGGGRPVRHAHHCPQRPVGAGHR